MIDNFPRRLPCFYPSQHIVVQKIPCFALVVNTIQVGTHVALQPRLRFQHPPWCRTSHTTDCLSEYSTGSYIRIFPACT